MPLVAGIVHRQHGRRGLRETLGAEGGAQVDGDERGVPVVGVDEQRTRHEPRERGERGEREECEAAEIVGVVHGVLAVDPRAVEELAVLDEEDLRSRHPAGDPEDSRLLVARTYRHQKRRTHRLEVGLDVADGAIEREDGGNVQA